MPTMQDLAAAQTTDAATIATDTATIAAAVAAVTADTAQQSTDTTNQATDAATFSAALATTGPIAIVSTDNTVVSVYIATPGTAPGYSLTTYPLAGTVPVPAAGPKA